MKKYRVTNLHEVLKAGYEFSHDVSIPFVKLILNGSELTIYTDDILRHHPTWYEEVKPERWKPKQHSFFWFVTAGLQVCSEEWINSLETGDKWRNGNCFETKEQAEDAAERVCACLLAYQEEITK